MPMPEDLVRATEKLHRARSEQIAAMASLVGMTRAMPMPEDLAQATEKLRRARGEQISAMASLVGMTRADINRDLPEAGARFVNDRAAELIDGGHFEGHVSLHTLLAALRDAWKAGAVHEARAASEGP